ncbi:MAG: hypothetical protein KatS3mg087_0310 [Patescibacteria group bacterium]|nr:MAG: hypothetical protein KatS3mg087_0310 [Patescibacteria group bacterium]
MRIQWRYYCLYFLDMQKTTERLEHDQQVEQALIPTGRYNDQRFRRLLALKGKQHPGYAEYRVAPASTERAAESYYAQKARVLGKK